MIHLEFGLFFSFRGELGEGLSINCLELLAVLIACRQYGNRWARKRIRMHCDNTASCFTLGSGASKSPTMMVAQRGIALEAARCHFQIRGDWISTHDNIGADAASRDDIERLRTWAKRTLGATTLTQVEPLLDIEAYLRRMQKALVSEQRRLERSTR